MAIKMIKKIQRTDPTKVDWFDQVSFKFELMMWPQERVISVYILQVQINDKILEFEDTVQFRTNWPELMDMINERRWSEVNRLFWSMFGGGRYRYKYE